MASNQSVVQARVVEPRDLKPNNVVQRIALYGPNGEPLVLTDIPSKGTMKSLKARVTKLEKRITALEEELA